jgi:hypothetical protein
VKIVGGVCRVAAREGHVRPYTPDTGRRGTDLMQSACAPDHDAKAKVPLCATDGSGTPRCADPILG